MQNQYIDVFPEFLYLFYFERYSHLNQRTVRHLGLIILFLSSLTTLSRRHKRHKPFKATRECHKQSNIAYNLFSQYGHIGIIVL